MESIFNTGPSAEERQRAAFIWRFRRDLVAQWPTLTPEKQERLLNSRTLPAPQPVKDPSE